MDRVGRKLARRNPLLEKVVQLCKCAVLGLGQEEEDPNGPDAAQPKVQHASLGAPVPRVAARVEHARVELLQDDLANDIHGSPEHDGLRPDTARGRLPHDRVGRRAERQLEDQVDKDHDDRHGDGDVVGARHEAQDADDQHEETNARGPVEKENATPDPAHQRDGNRRAHDIHGLDTHVEVEGLHLGHAGRLQEDGGISTDGLAVEDLDDPGHADDAGSAQVGATETVAVGRTRRLDLLHLVGMLHQRERLGHALLCVVALAREAAQGLLSILEASATDKVPGTLRRHKADNEQWDNPNPLQGVRNTPCKVTGETQ